MKIYQFTHRGDLETWLQALPYRWIFGHSGTAITMTPFKPIGEGWHEAQSPITVPFESFHATGWSEAEVCMKLALQVEEYLAQKPGATTIRSSGLLKVDSERDFDTDKVRHRARIVLLADARLDAIDAERAKRAA